MSRMATRSARAALSPARLGKTPGYSTGSSPASSGCWTYLRNCLSSDAGSEFQRSFSPIGTMTSLNSGLPRRDTWTQGPASEPKPGSRTTAAGRLAAAHTPMTEFWDIGLVGVDPSGELGDRDLERDRVHAEAVGGVDPGGRRRPSRPGAGSATAAGHRGRKSPRGRHRTPPAAGRRTRCGRRPGSGPPARPAPHSSASRTGRCCTAGTPARCQHARAPLCSTRVTE